MLLTSIKESKQGKLLKIRVAHLIPERTKKNRACCFDFPDSKLDQVEVGNLNIATLKSGLH